MRCEILGIAYSHASRIVFEANKTSSAGIFREFAQIILTL